MKSFSVESNNRAIVKIDSEVYSKEVVAKVAYWLSRDFTVLQSLDGKNWTGHEYIDVAACGRTLRFQDNSFRMELCGYFPTNNPQYTIMVVLEKDGLPASAGGMCGPLFSQIVDGLLSHL